MYRTRFVGQWQTLYFHSLYSIKYRDRHLSSWWNVHFIGCNLAYRHLPVWSEENKTCLRNVALAHNLSFSRLVELRRHVEVPELGEQRIPVDEIASVVESQILRINLHFGAIGRCLGLTACGGKPFAQRLSWLL